MPIKVHSGAASRTALPSMNKPSATASYSGLFHLLTFGVLLVAAFCAGAGLLVHGPGQSQEVVNQYGDVVHTYGRGLYHADSFFRAPIFRGTDAAMLLLACPWLLFSLVSNIRRPTLVSRMQLVALLGSFLYYAISVAMGVQYNQLHLLYILLCSLSFYGLVWGWANLQRRWPPVIKLDGLPLKGIRVFLSLTGFALLIAWLPDIIGATKAGRALLLIEHYTTEITYVLDMGIIAPACFVCSYLLPRHPRAGLMLLDLLLTLCLLIGVMLPVQTWFQVQAGIDLPAPVLVTKVGSFCVLALFALYFKLRLQKVVYALSGGVQPIEFLPR